MKNCLYQGSFNPIHNAHIKVAEFALEKFNFDKIIFIPAFKPPHKDEKDFDVENAFHRLNMVELAIKNNPNFDVSAIEFTRNKPSYTYDTIVQIKQITKEKNPINFIIGSDAFSKIESWYKAEELKHLLNFILFVRDKNFDETPLRILKKKGFNYQLTNFPFLDISSSEIRQKIKNNESIYDIVPTAVADYIKKHDVYKIRN